MARRKVLFLGCSASSGSIFIMAATRICFFFYNVKRFMQNYTPIDSLRASFLLILNYQTMKLSNNETVKQWFRKLQNGSYVLQLTLSKECYTLVTVHYPLSLYVMFPFFISEIVLWICSPLCITFAIYFAMLLSEFSRRVCLSIIF